MNVTLLIEEINTLDIQCKELLASNTPLLISIKKIQDLLAEHYSEAKQNFIEYTFESTDQQIDYFKLYHSKLISLCLYYNYIQSIERRLLHKPIKKQLKILREEINAIHSISSENQSFISYITEQHTHLDEYYFIQNQKNKSIDGFSFINRDPSFSTHHSHLLGEILANHRTLNYINGKLDNLNNTHAFGNSSLITLKWKRKKVDFVEVIRALHAEGAFDEDITKVFNALSQVIDTGPINHFGVFKDIKYRSNAKTRYLNKAALALDKLIDQDYD